MKIFVKGVEEDGLIDSGNSKSFIHPNLVECHSLVIHYSLETVFMVQPSLPVQTSGFYLVVLRVDGQDYQGVSLAVLPQLCSMWFLDRTSRGCMIVLL